MYINEISKKYHISKKAINIYEEKGLVKPIKDSMGYRNYSKEDIQQLLRIKQLRNLEFSIQEIDNILNHCQYKIFDQKIKQYQKRYYEIDTSLQYIQEVKEAIVDNQDIQILSQEMDQTFDLKNIDIQEQITYPFEFYSFILLTIGLIILLKNQPDDLYSLLVFILWLTAGSLNSALVQTFIYKTIKRIKK